MGKSCDFYIEQGSKYWCVIKKAEISYETYREYCYCDDMKKCPIYMYMKENK